MGIAHGVSDILTKFTAKVRISTRKLLQIVAYTKVDTLYRYMITASMNYHEQNIIKIKLNCCTFNMLLYFLRRYNKLHLLYHDSMR